MAAEMEDLKAIWHDLKARVEELAGERQQYLDFFEQADDAYVVTDGDGVISEANGAAVDILQRRKVHLRGKPFAALVALDQRPRFRESLREVMGGGRSAFATIVVAAQTRTEVRLTGRAIGAPAAGVCWRLEAPQ
jgi:two-component system cell cycle sensor histidine kinase/response regulator CckA